MKNKIKVFKLTDTDWWAGESLEQVKEDFISWNIGINIDNKIFKNAYEISENDINSLKYYDRIYCRTKTFRQQLNLLIENRQKFPCAFVVKNY